MHERSLMKALLKQVEAIRRRHNAAEVSEVRVEIGPLSGVEGLQLGAAFEEQAVCPSLQAARLVIDEVPLSAECKSCQQAWEVQDFVFRCPECGGNARVTRGDEFQLVSVSLQPEAVEETASGNVK